MAIEQRLDPEANPSWEDWPTQTKAAELLGISARQIVRRCVTGSAQRWRAPDGTWRFRPDEVERLAGIVEPSIEPTEVAVQTAEGALAALLTEQIKHQEQLLMLLLKPSSVLLEMLGAENTRLRERCEKLENSHERLIETREKLLTETHERKLMTVAAENQEARKTKALAAALDQLPKIMGPKAAAASELFSSLKDTLAPEELGALTGEDSFLNPRQRALLAQLLADDKPKPKTMNGAQHAEPHKEQEQ